MGFRLKNQGINGLGLSLLVASLSAHGGIDPSKGILFERAVVTKEIVKRTADWERSFARSAYRPAPAGTPWFVLKEGNSRVLILAPHSTAQIRKGNVKAPDTGTGGLALALNEIAHTPALVTTYRSPDDPNYSDDNEFKATLARFLSARKPALVLDLHASDATRSYDVDFGTRHGASLLGRVDYLKSLSDRLLGAGVRTFSQDFFAADRNQTNTKWVSLRGVPCIQLEINETWLDSHASPLATHRYSALLEGLTRFIHDIDAHL